MADRKISDLTALTTPASGDYLPIVDISEALAANKNKRITVEELLRGAPDGTAAAPSFAFESDPDSGLYSADANAVAISTGGTERARIDSNGYFRLAGGGIQFNGDTAAVNALDDYEEGTWTPTITVSGTEPTITYTAQIGQYTKIGNVVFCRLGINFNITVAGSGNVFVSLPITTGSFTTWAQHADVGYNGGSVIIDNIAAITGTNVAQLYTSEVADADSAATTGSRNFTLNFFYRIP